MACSDYASGIEFLRAGQFFDAITCTFTDSFGILLGGLMFFGVIGLALYIYSGGIELPLVVGIVVGAAAITQLPAIAAQLVGVVLIIGLALGGLALVLRLNASG